jgi:heat shock protein HslJ
MSGFHFDYRVQVQAQKDGMSEPVVYEGCGAYQGDYRLNDIWALESMGGEPVEKSGKAPNLEFHLMEGRFYGFAGCNRINGSIEMTEKTIRFGQAAATKKLCPDMDMENRFMEMIDGKELKFSLEERLLTLGGGEGKLIFRKVD